MSKQDGQISMPVIRRLPKYYRCLCTLEQSGVEKISSRKLAEIMNITASQVRQDLNCFGGFGQQGYGYYVATLKEELATLLGIDTIKNTIIYGIGNLGRAVLFHFDFEKFGFRLMGLFDKHPELVGTTLAGFKINDENSIKDFMAENKVDAAILCLPTVGTDVVVEKLYNVGIRNFLNFSHFDIVANYPDCVVENVHLSESLMTLAYLMKNKDKD